MKSLKINAPAKVNFTLDVAQGQNGFHDISSLVNTISLCDVIKVKKRKDDKIILKCKGVNPECDVQNNNAYKTAKEFVSEFATGGVTITLKKKIPVGGGLGGSSADVAGVLNALKALYGVEKDLSYIANRLGSDTAYMLNGGWAVIQGRGEIITPVDARAKFYLVMLTCPSGVSAGACYKKFDELGIVSSPTTSLAVDSLKKGDMPTFYSCLKNDLYLPATTFASEIQSNLEFLKSFAPSIMTGSGSVTVALFTDKKLRNLAYKKLRKIYDKKVLKAHTL